MNKKGFTLVELLIAMTVFGLVGMLSSEIFVNVMRYNKRMTLEGTIYTDARYIMGRIVRELQRNTIDYEEYYNKKVLIGEYSANYGKYSDAFFELGSDSEKGGGCVNIQSQNDVVAGPPCDTEAGYFLDKNTVDINTGENPKKTSGLGPSSASAVCDENMLVPCTDDDNIQTELYLIDSSGTKKTMLGKEKVDDGLLGADYEQYALSILQMNGYDTNEDKIIDTWLCADEYTCTGGNVQLPNGVGDWMEGGVPKGKYPLADDLSDIEIGTLEDFYNDFIPISPFESTIADLKFVISPLEDPLKAFAERADDIQLHPFVTVILKVEPAPDQRSGYFGEIPSVTFQTTVSMRM